MMDNRSVYILTAVKPVESATVEDYVYDDAFSIMCTRETIGVYDDIAKVEADIGKLVADNKELNEKWGGWVEYFAFIVTEHYLNDTMDDNGGYASFESVRSYLGNGELNCFSDYDDRCKKKFVGLKEHQRFVKDGDYCLMLSGDRIKPILLAKCTPTEDDLKKQFNHPYVGDFTDDSGLGFVVGYGHTHPFTSHVFPLSNLKNYTMSDELKNELLEEQKRYDDGEL